MQQLYQQFMRLYEISTEFVHLIKDTDEQQFERQMYKRMVRALLTMDQAFDENFKVELRCLNLTPTSIQQIRFYLKAMLTFIPAPRSTEGTHHELETTILSGQSGRGRIPTQSFHPYIGSRSYQETRIKWQSPDYYSREDTLGRGMTAICDSL